MDDQTNMPNAPIGNPGMGQPVMPGTPTPPPTNPGGPTPIPQPPAPTPTPSAPPVQPGTPTPPPTNPGGTPMGNPGQGGMNNPMA